MDGLECAGKRMFHVLVDPRNEGAERMTQKYYEECELLSSLCHPNIVQFLGSQSTSTTNLPVLVMEMLQGSLDDFLQDTPDIPLAKKISILQDVARGLVYLHSRTRAVIHRDLTARNVLLNSALVAKIADMGNSQIVESSALLTASQVPGTLVYMPPEAMNSSAKYNTSLDIFSFGHLSLFTATQVFPGNLLPANYQHPKTGKIVGYTEVERRREYMGILETKLTKSHALVGLIKKCLTFDPTGRPSASNVLERLVHISSDIDDPYHRMTKLDLEKRVLALEEQMRLQEPLAIQGLEKRERDLLAELKQMKGVEKKERMHVIKEPYVESNGLLYDLTKGDISGNRISIMIIVAVGTCIPSGIEIEQRKRNPDLAQKAFQTHGQLPSFVTGLHKEAAADLMATASNHLRSVNVDLVRICLAAPLCNAQKVTTLRQLPISFDIQSIKLLPLTTWDTVRKVQGTGASKTVPSATAKFSTSTSSTATESSSRSSQIAPTLDSGS
jgi:hypothetical protein